LPLLEGKKNVSRNISELMAAYKRKGKIGETKPKSKKHALQMAIAIALNKAKK